MSKKEQTAKAELSTPTLSDPFQAGAAIAAKRKPIEMGVQHFDSNAGNTATGYFMGIRRIDKTEVTDETKPDNRRSTLETVYLRVSPYLVMRTANASAVQHFMGLPAGSYVRLTCTQKAAAGERAAQFKLELLATADEVAEALGGDITPIVSGFLE